MVKEKKEFTIEELEKAYQEHKAETDALKDKIEKMKQEEKEKKEAQLALEKENRKKEVDEAFNKYSELLKAYIEDYGYYGTTIYADDYNWFHNKFGWSFF